MAAEDWLPPGWEIYALGYSRPVTCRRCHEEGLSWEKTQSGWRLFDGDGDPHHCSESAEEVFG